MSSTESSTSFFRFCPRCASPLEDRQTADRLRLVCSASCGFVHWNNPLPVVAVIVELEGQLFLARNAAWPPKMFALVTGFMEAGETPEEAVLRELFEETSLRARAGTAPKLVGVYEFMRKNELIIAYHVEAEGAVRLSEELVEYRLVAPERARPWRAGTGYALADWLRSRGITEFEWLELPKRREAEN
jgi:NAD+ diphosphatase